MNIMNLWSEQDKRKIQKKHGLVLDLTLTFESILQKAQNSYMILSSFQILCFRITLIVFQINGKENKESEISQYKVIPCTIVESKRKHVIMYGCSSRISSLMTFTIIKRNTKSGTNLLKFIYPKSDGGERSCVHDRHGGR